MARMRERKTCQIYFCFTLKLTRDFYNSLAHSRLPMDPLPNGSDHHQPTIHFQMAVTATRDADPTCAFPKKKPAAIKQRAPVTFHPSPNWPKLSLPHGSQSHPRKPSQTARPTKLNAPSCESAKPRAPLPSAQSALGKASSSHNPSQPS